MADSFFQQPKQPITATLANWAPKCNSEMEKRIRFDFEVPLTDELIALAPPSVQSVALAVGDLAGGLTQGIISTEFDQTIEIYTTPDHKQPVLTLSNVKLVNLCVFRPTPKDGPSSEVFLTFSVTAKAETPYGGVMATWAIESLRGTIFFRTFDVQGTLALTDAEPDPDQAKPKPKRGKAA